MANLVKISKVNLYLGLRTPQGAADCVAAQEFLDNAGVKYTALHYNDKSGQDATFQALGTWVFGPDFQSHTFTDFPFVHWTEYYDDYERFEEVAIGLDAIKNSNLINNKDKITD